MKKFLIYIFLFVVFILGGVFVKRVLGSPQFVVFFHIPGAVFLVLAGMALKEIRSEDYSHEVDLVRDQIKR